MDNQTQDGGEKEKKSWMFRVFRWITYTISILVILITIYRCATIGMPSELKNYIIGSQKIEQAYAELKDDFAMYDVEMRNPFGAGDALFVGNVHYLESTETMQLTLRCKTSRFPQLLGSDESAPAPFGAYLKISSTSEGEDADYVILDSAREAGFGKNKDNYVYFMHSFDDVAIDYANSKIELYVFKAASAAFDEDEALARITLFDVNMKKTKVQLKDFAIHY
jgi:hypothetical protein